MLVCGLLSAALSLPSIERDEAILGVNIGGMYMKQGRFEEALAEFLEVRRATPSAQRIEINIANAYHFMGREREALESLERAIRYLYEEGRRRGGVSAEELSYCHELSGDILRDQDATRQAREHYTAALRLAPGNARLQRKMAEL